MTPEQELELLLVSLNKKLPFTAPEAIAEVAARYVRDAFLRGYEMGQARKRPAPTGSAAEP